MLGDTTLRIPGTDHAGIATQVVVERALQKSEKKTRHDVGREKFLAKVWEWVGDSRQTIVSQTKRMWASCDRSREQFTMSERSGRSVRKAFTNLFEKKRIYKAAYMVNRSPGAQTVLSDLEVESKEVKWKMYYLRYFVEGKGDSITIATTRPETIFADVAVAVHPKDRRYKKWIGKNVLIPLINKPIPVVADEAIDFDLGTGAMKVAPTHDEMDYEIGKRHSLPMNQFAFDRTVKFTKLAWEHLEGKDIDEFFPNLLQMLDEIGNIEKIEDYVHMMPYCARTGCKVQPMLSEQWFMDVAPAAMAVREAFDQQTIKVHPERFIKIFDNWLEDIKPRCISRQLRWWHRIPVRYDAAGEQYAYDEDSALDGTSGAYKLLSMVIFNLIADSRLPNPFNVEELIETLLQPSLTPNDKTVVGAYSAIYTQKFGTDKKMLKEIEEIESIFGSMEHDGKAVVQAGGKILDMLEKACNIRPSGDKYQFYFSEKWKEKEIIRQEEDVLDTWFSSALRPFSTLGWPEETPDMKTYYPMTVLETGYDIIFFWVIRMLLMGWEQTAQRPFQNIYLHGLVKDEQWHKISKSKWNAIDPMQLIEKYGADPFRAALLQWNTPGTDVKFSEKKIDFMRRFLNKLWNATRFVTTRFVTDGEHMPEVSYNMLERDISDHLGQLNSYDTWMIGKLQVVVDQVGKYYGKFMLGEALQDTIDMVRHDFCDRYIEITKLQQSPYTPKVMLYTLLTVCKLLHPVVPHVTEKLRQLLGWEGILMTSAWPELSFEVEKNYKMNLLMDMISQWRHLRQQATEKPHEKVVLLVQANKQIQDLVAEHSSLIQHIIHAQEILYKDEFAEIEDEFHTTLIMDIKVGVKGVKSVDWKQKLVDLEKQVEEEENFLQRTRAMLTNDDFAKKASTEVVEEKKQKMQEVKQRIIQIQLEIQRIKMQKK